MPTKASSPGSAPITNGSDSSARRGRGADFIYGCRRHEDMLGA